MAVVRMYSYPYILIKTWNIIIQDDTDTTFLFHQYEKMGLYKSKLKAPIKKCSLAKRRTKFKSKHQLTIAINP